ncbi:MAG TPA: tetratricopeptide repeat protein [Vicinamibacterales bacterium]|jgi:tetratricopeptide (TPR) repeat protein|nr:tetratricopeptide repeat protein [Vicinamibacterales bacterium]
MRLLAVALAVALSEAPSNERAMGMLRDWVRFVDEHTAGETDAALDSLTAWTFDDLELMQAYVEALAEVPLNTQTRDARRRQITGIDLAEIKERTKDLQRRGDVDRFRKRAVILHTDAAILGAAPVVVDAPVPRQQRPAWARGEPEARVDVKSFDGRVDRFERANPNWQYSMSLLESLPAAPRRDPFVARWYRAVGAYFANERSYADAVRHFERALLVVPDDPLVLYGEACLQETLGAPRIQNYVRVTTLPNGLVIRDVSSPQTHLRRAESLLRKALAADSHFVEANLRLGRVLTQLKRYEEAFPYLQAAIADSRDRTVTYYAHLFSGDAALALGRLPDSRLSYEIAVALYPDSQASRLGLAAALRAAGDRPAALAAMARTLTKPAASRDSDDPWWDYYLGDATNVERLIQELWEPLRSRKP